MFIPRMFNETLGRLLEPKLAGLEDLDCIRSDQIRQHLKNCLMAMGKGVKHKKITVFGSSFFLLPDWGFLVTFLSSRSP